LDIRGKGRAARMGRNTGGKRTHDGRDREGGEGREGMREVRRKGREGRRRGKEREILPPRSCLKVGAYEFHSHTSVCMLE